MMSPEGSESDMDTQLYDVGCPEEDCPDLSSPEHSPWRLAGEDVPEEAMQGSAPDTQPDTPGPASGRDIICIRGFAHFGELKVFPERGGSWRIEVPEEGLLLYALKATSRCSHADQTKYFINDQGVRYMMISGNCAMCTLQTEYALMTLSAKLRMMKALSLAMNDNRPTKPLGQPLGKLLCSRCAHRRYPENAQEYLQRMEEAGIAKVGAKTSIYVVDTTHLTPVRLDEVRYGIMDCAAPSSHITTQLLEHQASMLQQYLLHECADVARFDTLEHDRLRHDIPDADIYRVFGEP